MNRVQQLVEQWENGNRSYVVMEMRTQEPEVSAAMSAHLVCEIWRQLGGTDADTFVQLLHQGVHIPE